MKIAMLKAKGDDNHFPILSAIGGKLIEVEDMEKTDDILRSLVEQQYTSIWLSNEVASFSQDIITKYETENGVHIFISPSNRI